MNNSNNIIIGTEFGVWSTNGSSWIVEDDGMPLVPCPCYVSSICRGQQRLFMLVLTDVVSSNCNTSSLFDYTNDDSDDVNMLSIYPNPAESFINLELSSISMFTMYPLLI